MQTRNIEFDVEDQCEIDDREPPDEHAADMMDEAEAAGNFIALAKAAARAFYRAEAQTELTLKSEAAMRGEAEKMAADAAKMSAAFDGLKRLAADRIGFASPADTGSRPASQALEAAALIGGCLAGSMSLILCALRTIGH